VKSHLVLFAVAAAALGGCGGSTLRGSTADGSTADGSAADGSGLGGSCSGTTSCGGYVVGTWSVAHLCLGSMIPGASTACAGELVDASAVQETGTVTLSADLTYTSTVAITGTETITIPNSCLTNATVTITCDQLNQMLQQQQSSPGIASASCAAPGADACVCTYVFSGQTVSQTGVYATAGAKITLTPSGGAAATDDYCVEGSTMRIATSNMMGMTTAVEVLTRH
jgi:hypothetical protein